MDRHALRHFLFFYSGLCVFCALLLGLWTYFLEATDAAAPVRGPGSGNASANPTAPSRPKPDVPFVDQNAHLVERNTFYQSLPAQDAQTRRLEDQARVLETFEKDPDAFVEKYYGNARTFLFDAVIDAKNMVRVGTFDDGGKWVSDPESLKPGTVVYSFGVGYEISFDTDMAGLYGCEVHCFDPTPSVERTFADYKPGQTLGKGKFWFHPVGLGPTSFDPEKADELVIEDRKCPVKRLGELADELGHTQVEILKLDIEGGEMAALTEMLDSGTLQKLGVKQLMVEFHLWDDDLFRGFVRVINGLRQQGYLLFRKEFNPLDSGRCAEFCFLSTK